MFSSYKALLLVACSLIGPLAFAHQSSTFLRPERLTCEGKENPVGVDQSPHLSWIITAGEGLHDVLQNSHQILVASNLRNLNLNRGDLWDSGRIKSSESIRIPYRGKALGDSQQVFWKVRIWDQHGRASEWSKPATWTTGLSNWKAHWIQGTPNQAVEQTKGGTISLRKSFSTVPGRKLVGAVVHVCGLGQYALFLNGQRVGKDVLAPGWTNYRKTCLYDSYDVKNLFAKGLNQLTMPLGSGMYNVVEGRYTKFTGTFGPLKAILQLELHYSDGSRQTVSTDSSWQVASGPITFSSPYGGEDFDARIEEKLKTDDQPWSGAVETQGPGGELRGASFSAPSIKPFEQFKPKVVRRISDTVAVYDFGQNASIMPTLVVDGPAGAVVKMTPAELVHPDGTVDRGSVGGGEAYWKYTVGASGKQTYVPLFFYQGARYIQVETTTPEGAPNPKIVSLTARVVGSSSPAAGTFTCEDPLFDRIHKLIWWAQRSNTVSLLTDCPHRERLGWLEQTHLNGPSLRYNFSLGSLFGKIENDIAEAQMDNGFVSDIAPEFVNFAGNPNDFSNPFRNSVEWGSAYLLVPWQQYLFEGDLSIFRDHFDGMKRYVDWLTTQAKDGLLNFGLGDWYDIGPGGPGFSQLTPIPLTATAFYYQDAVILAEAARLLKKPIEATKYKALAASIKATYNAKFYNPKTHQYATGSQCANSISLVMGLAPKKDRAEILDNVVKDIESKGLTAGDVGYRYLLRALADGGRSDVVYTMNNQSTKPGYGYQLAHGATSLTEAWDAGRSSSQNHFMLGQIEEWFYHDLAGIQPDPAKPGFKHFFVKPFISVEVSHVKATYDSPYGPIKVSWSAEPDGLKLSVDVPPNTTATVVIPRAIYYRDGLWVDSGYRNLTYTAGSGHHTFN